MRPSIQCGMFIMLCVNPIYSMQQTQFDGFTTINKDLLGEIQQKKPESLKTLAQQQAWHMLAWAYFRHNNELPLDTFMRQQDFKPHSPPLNLTQFLNERLPCGSEYRAKVLGYEHLDEQDLLDTIKTHIDRGTPLMAYYIRDEYYNLSFIFGYKIRKNNQQQAQILLKTTESNDTHVMTTNELIAYMDLSTNIALLKSHMPYKTYFRNKDHSAFLYDLVQQLSNFTFIAFEREENSSHSFALPCCQIL